MHYTAELIASERARAREREREREGGRWRGRGREIKGGWGGMRGEGEVECESFHVSAPEKEKLVDLQKSANTELRRPREISKQTNKKPTHKLEDMHRHTYSRIIHNPDLLLFLPQKQTNK